MCAEIELTKPKGPVKEILEVEVPFGPFNDNDELVLIKKKDFKDLVRRIGLADKPQVFFGSAPQHGKPSFSEGKRVSIYYKRKKCRKGSFVAYYTFLGKVLRTHYVYDNKSEDK